MDLRAALLEERLQSYHRVRGGYPLPLAGAMWWAALALFGYSGMPLSSWIFAAAVSSGLIFPLALALAKLCKCNFMGNRTSVTDLLGPAFASMLLFWPMAIAAWWTQPALFPLILAIGMSLHWPIIGWSYGKTVPFTFHAIARALICFLIWWRLPDARLTLLPLSVSVIYLGTVGFILWDTRARAAVRPQLA